MHKIGVGKLRSKSYQEWVKNNTCLVVKCSPLFFCLRFSQFGSVNSSNFLAFLILFFVCLFVFFFQDFKRLLNTPQRYNTNVTIYYKYVTLHYTMNFNGKVTIQKKKKIRSKYRQHYGTESKGRGHFLLNLPMLFSYQNVILFSYQNGKLNVI